MNPIKYAFLIVGIWLLSGCIDNDGLPWWCKGSEGTAPSADLNVIGCARPTKAPKGLPYPAWELRFAHPNYMEYWIESAQVLDVDGRWARNAGGGTGSFGYQGDGPVAEGWTNRHGMVPVGSGRRMSGINLPEEIHVRWQSRVEGKVYQLQIDFPEWARQKMVTPNEAVSPRSGETRTQYRNLVTLGLAPGGKVKVWIQGTWPDAIEVLSLQAELEERGPYLGQEENVVPPSPEALEYVEKYGIPYETW
ncbi:MAG: DUF2931 family protein [Alcanivorax sp.]|nr:DUF2931 family protein [Alcanivorax sp.]